MKYQTYPAYKDSGVEWLGDVPEHWDVIQIKHLSAVQRGASPRPIDDPKYFDDEGEYAWVRIADVSSSDGVLRETTQRLSNLGNSLSVKIHSGELFISIAGTVGKPCISAIKACIHDGFVYFPTLKIPPIFLYRIFEAGLCYGGLGKLGTQLNLNTETIGAIRVALPNEKELEHVLNFLDHETAKIDTLIEKQQRLIELLKEKRQAVISHAVTKGLNPNAPMKDSGVEWLGEVPEHWEVSKFGYVKTVLTDYTANGSFADLKTNVIYRDEPSFARLVRLTDLRMNLDNENGVWIDEKSYNYLRKSALFGGEFLLANVGAYAGLFYQMPDNKGNASLAPNMFMAKFETQKIFPEFMAYIGQSDAVNKQLTLSATSSSAQPKLNKDDFKSVQFAYPDIDEQEKIAIFLNKKTIQIDFLTEKANSAIELMQERRTALISAAVTGKIDVREWDVL